MDKQLYFDIHNLLEQSVSDCYVRYFMDELANDIASDVMECSAYAEEDGMYTDSDIRLAIGRVLMDRLDIQYY